MKDEIIKILMDRDGVTIGEARNIVAKTQRIIDKHLEEGKFGVIEDDLATMLGLEMDYIWAFV